MYNLLSILVIQGRAVPSHVSRGFLSRGNAFNNNFDHTLLPSSYEFESFRCLFKLETISYESLDVNFTTGYEVHSCWIASNRVPN